MPASSFMHVGQIEDGEVDYKAIYDCPETYIEE
jgi:hypothetical protein